MKPSLGIASVVVIAIVWTVFVETWRFRECKQVGHSTAYCLILNHGE